MRKLVLFSFVGLALLVAAILYFQTGMSAKAASFRVERAERGSIVSTVSSSGSLSAVITVLVGSQVSGQIMELLVDFNSEVKEGQVIARIDPETFKARVLQAEAELAVALANVVIQEAAVERARAELENVRSELSAAEAQTEKAKVAVGDAELDLTRKRKLHGRKIISESDLDKANATYEQALAQLSTAKAEQEAQVSVVRSREAALKMAEGQVPHAQAQVKQREASLRQSKIDLAHSVIRSPVDGVVVERNVDVGQTVAASLQAPTLFTIAKDLRKMQVETNVDEADIGRVRVGQRAPFTVDAFPGHEFSGEVKQIRMAPHTIQNVVTYTVVVSTENPDLSLLPGMTANVKIIVEERHNVLRVPNAALRFRPPGEKESAAGASGGAGSDASAANGAGAAEKLKRIIEALGLDEKQQARVQGMFSETRKKVMDMRQKGATAEEIRAEVLSMREKHRVALLAILNEAQRDKFRQLSEARARKQVAPGRVWVVGEDMKASPIQVMTGVSDGSFTEILRGNLKPGQEVIIGMNQSSSLTSAGKKKAWF
jgi:HlyD family secretion protein